MTGLENYTRTIERKGAAYLPCAITLDLHWLQEKDESKSQRIQDLLVQMPDDFVEWINPAMNSVAPTSLNGVSRWIDEWQTGWEDDGYGAKTITHPLQDSYDLMDKYIFPDPLKPGRFDEIDKRLLQRGDRYVQSVVWFTLFERLWMLRGFENMLIDPYTDEEKFCYLRDRIVDYNLAIIDQLLQRKVNAIFFSDDWGSQRGLLMAPDDWRKFYKPSYQRLFERVRSGGSHVWMHLCGNIISILPDLIDLGLNVLNPVQPQAMDIHQLSREFGGQVCFYGGVDVQGTLVNGTPLEVKKSVHELVSLFGRFNGGYIGGTSHSIMPETPLDNVIALFEAFAEYRY